MPVRTTKRPRTGESMRGQPKKKIRYTKKQQEYHSSSEDEEKDRSSGANSTEIGKRRVATDNHEVLDGVAMDTEDKTRTLEAPADIIVKDAPADEIDDSASGSSVSEGNAGSDADSESLSDDSAIARSKKRKRQDPDAFANSITKILGSKLSNSKRADPVLARSKDAALASKEMSEAKLETKVKNKIRDEKRAALEKGREKDVLALESTDKSTGQALEEERRLKKTAQRGVVKLFNAVRAAQVKGEEAAREARKSQVVGMDRREEKATEMSKQGFLDLIAGGGKAATPSVAA